jgi:membrane-associated phospholipid phosphatase
VSAAGGLDDTVTRLSRLRQVHLNMRVAIATLLRPPSRQISWPAQRTVGIGAAAAIAAVYASMILLDGWAILAVRQWPGSLVQAFNDFTDFGKSGYFLWPLGIVLIALALFDSPAVPRFSRHVLAAWAVRLGFVFTAIAVPGLFVAIVKRLIGRARPHVAGNDVWTYMPFGWKVEYTSLPSGHTTTAFSALVAIGAIFPQARALMWIYAVLIALSRVVVTAHHPSDVIAGAIVGAVGALLVRHWFAARRLGFKIGAHGAIYAMPGPSWRRIVKAITRRP